MDSLDALTEKVIDNAAHAWTPIKLLPAVTFGLMVYGARKHYKNWKKGFFASMVHLDVVSITKSASNPSKYHIFPRTIFHKPLRKIIDNDHGIKKIQKAAKQCTFEQPFINIQPIADQWYFHNSVICAMEQDFKELWLQRDVDLSNGYKTNIMSQKYILALAFPWNLSYDEVKHLDELNEYDVSGHKVHKKIRGFLINEDTMRELSDMEEFFDLKRMDVMEWIEYLDLNQIPQGTPMHLDIILKWSFVKRMIEKYQRNPCKWAEPLCTVEVPILNNRSDMISIYDLPHTNVYHPTHYFRTGLF